MQLKYIPLLCLACCLQTTLSKSIRSKKEASDSGFDCVLRAGREIFIKIPIEHTRDAYLQSIEKSSGEVTDHKYCRILDNNHYCKTLNIYGSKQKMLKAYKYRAIDAKTGEPIWEGRDYVVPQHLLFYCYKSHSIEKIHVNQGDKGVTLSWKKNYWDSRFSPKHTVTIDGVRNGQELEQKDCGRDTCKILIQNTGECVVGIKKVCVKTKFDLKDGKNKYKKRHMVETCTVYDELCSYPFDNNKVGPSLS